LQKKSQTFLHLGMYNNIIEIPEFRQPRLQKEIYFYFALDKQTTSPIWSILHMTVTSLVAVVAPCTEKIIKSDLNVVKKKKICYKLVYFILCLG